MNPYELHPERLATTDEHGNRIYLHPEDVHGKWRDRRRIVYTGLILLYILLPWFEVNGHQSILINLPQRYFVFFGFEFFGHDTPYLFFLIIGFAFLMAFATSILGRVWCGWVCPQTVFIDIVFRPIERLIEGNAKKQRELDSQPLSLKKVILKSLKWTIFIFVSLIISHSFLGYFLGTHNLFQIITHSPLEHWESFIVMLVATTITAVDFGWFREQFCIIMCPYGRFQSVIMDSDSLVVAYDEKRGEPRRDKTIPKESQGDCINCYHCVRVCPTGIDIRRGAQLECIACTMCIDACDEMMLKLKKPPGLIRYTSENKLLGLKSSIFKARSFVYLFILFVILGSSFYFLGKRNNLQAYYIRGNNNPYQEIVSEDKTKKIINHYKIELTYQGRDSLELYFATDSPSIEVVTPLKPFKLAKGKKKTANVFFKFPVELLKSGLRKIKVRIYNTNIFSKENMLHEKEITLVGPIR